MGQSTEPANADVDGESDLESVHLDPQTFLAAPPWNLREDEDDLASLPSALRNNVSFEQLSVSEMQDMVVAEVGRWPGEHRSQAIETVQVVMSLLQEAHGGVLVVVSPMSQLRQLQT